MKRKTTILASLYFLTVVGMSTSASKVDVGDSLEWVYQQLGKPVVEYPVNEIFVQEYRSCTVISSNRTVIAVNTHRTDKKSEPPEEQSVEIVKPTMTINEVQEMANEGNAEAQYILAYCFQIGKLVDEDQETAVQWYTRAAMQNHVAAQNNLGYMYINGQGVEKNLQQAYKWALLAEENGSPILRKSLDHLLETEEKRAAKMMAQHLRLEMESHRIHPTKIAADTPID